MNKEEIINKVFRDPAGYQSISNTLKEVRQIDKSITYQDVKQWKENNFIRKTNLKGYNSYIAPEPYYEYQIDILFFSDLPNQEFKQALIMIDIFTKFLTVIPIKSKQIGDVAAGIIEGIHKMGKKPKIIFSDDEGALNSNVIQDYFKTENIKHITTRTHAHYAERAVRTIKDMIYKRYDDDKKENKQWTDYLYPVLLTYNYKNKHSSHGFSPNDARQSQNEIEVKLKLELKRQNKRKYPDINIGDNVRVF